MANDNESSNNPESIISSSDNRMDKSAEALIRDLNGYRTGRATPSLVE